MTSRWGGFAPHAFVASALTALALVPACGGDPKAPPAGVERFNRALCPKDPAPDLSRPIDPELEGATASLNTPLRVVKAAAELRLELMLRNTGLRRMVLILPQQAFTLEGFEVVDHNCVPVRYARPTTARALSYRDSGPIPLGVGESVTIDSTLDGLAPGLELRRGIYGVRFALKLQPSIGALRGKTLYSDWALFAVRGLSANPD